MKGRLKAGLSVGMTETTGEPLIGGDYAMLRFVKALSPLMVVAMFYAGCSEHQNASEPAPDTAMMVFPPDVDTSYAAVGGRVWYDADMDGIQGDSLAEPGVEKVTIYLYNCDGALLDSTASGDNGYYFFESLPFGDVEGRYYLQFTFPEDTDFGPRTDEVTLLLPVWLGTVAGAKSIEVAVADTAVAILGMKEYGKPPNGITKLYAQLLAAKLNIAKGADDAGIAETVAAADLFLADQDWNDWQHLSKVEKDSVLSWQQMLDDYNNGVIGPGHCENVWVFSPLDQGGDDELDSDADPVSGLTDCLTFLIPQSDWTVDAGLYLLIDENCTRTIGFWKNHSLAE